MSVERKTVSDITVRIEEFRSVNVCSSSKDEMIITYPRILWYFEISIRFLSKRYCRNEISETKLMGII